MGNACQSCIGGRCSSRGKSNIKLAFDFSNTYDLNQDNRNKHIEVKFKSDRRGAYLNKSNVSLSIGANVVIKTNSGWDVGIISSRGVWLDKAMDKKSYTANSEESYILREANAEEIQKWRDNIKKEKETLLKAREIIRSYKLNMKLSDVEYQGDGQKIYFYYVADDRVDFRELLKSLVQEFKKKIELKQIGQRQESAKIGAVGSCGRELCCSSWLKDFRSVNIEAVKYQQLSISSDKIIGNCGKLKCCMNYELDNYVEKLKIFPSKKTILKTREGDAQLVKIDVLKNLVWYVYVDSDNKNTYKLDVNKANYVIKKNKEGLAVSSLEDIQEI